MLFVLCFTCILDKPNILLLLIKEDMWNLEGDIDIVYDFFNRFLLPFVHSKINLFSNQSIFFFIFLN